MKIQLRFCFGICLSLLAGNVMAMQTCNSRIPASTPTARFIINVDNTVIDSQTGLMWARCTEGTSGSDCTNGNTAFFSWESAMLSASNSSLAGHNNWRVPNIKELESIIERQCDSPAINESVFLRTANTFYLSSTPNISDADMAWMVFFQFGVVTDNSRTAGWPLRLVRDIE